MRKWIVIGDTLLNLDFISEIEVDEWTNPYRASTYRIIYYNEHNLIEKYEEHNLIEKHEEYETDEEACKRFEEIKKFLLSD